MLAGVIHATERKKGAARLLGGRERRQMVDTHRKDVCLDSEVQEALLQCADERARLNDCVLGSRVVVEAGLVAEGKAGMGEAALLEVVVH